MEKPFLITYEYPPDIGGIASYIKEEVEDFNSKLGGSGSVFVMRVKNKEWRLWPKWFPILWRARPIINKENFDSLWISHILPIGYIALIYKKLFKIKYRIYVHGLDLVLSKKTFLKRFFTKRILSNAYEIVANSNATRELLKFYGARIYERANIVYPKVREIEVEKYKDHAIAIRKKYNLENKKILLSISRLVQRKGIDLVIDALEEVWKDFPDIVYVIIGSGDKEEFLKSKALGRENIIFTGAVSDEEKYAWICASDCFILTPRDEKDDFEGYGIIYKEVAQFGKKIIASRTGGVPEAVGNSGILVEPGNVKEIAQAIMRYAKS